MSIRFRFRSSVTFDSVDIGGRCTISVGELRDMIIRLKKLNSCQNFDLELSDADSGREFEDDSFQIQSGASVIVKRVPAKALPSRACVDAAAEDFLTKGSHSENLSGLFDDFDNFGDCPIPVTSTPDTAVELTKKCGIRNIQEGLRSFSPKIKSSNAKPDVPAVLNIRANVGKPVSVEKIEHLNLVRNNRMSGQDHDALQNSTLPAEMKCPLCTTYFKEAVMIPCCQRSFCANCIRQVLIDKGRCPKCFSGKFTVGNLLPNIALRKAIEHFLLASEKLIFEPECVLRKEAPDGESGIQAIDVSCPVGHKAHSPATGNGSDRVILAQNAPLGFPQTNLQDEADSTNMRKRELRVDTGARERNFMPSVGYNKVRTCYKCGSPDHLIRDCPLAFDPYPVPPTGPGVVHGGIPGYQDPYWNGGSYPSIRPVPNIYTNPGMMPPFHAPHFPMSPYGPPPSVQSFYSGFSPPGGYMGMRPTEHQVDRFERPNNHFGFSGIQPNEETETPAIETFFRGQDGDDNNFHGRQLYREPDRSPQHRFNKERVPGGGHYEDILPRNSHRHQLSEHANSDAYSLEGKHGKSSRSFGRERSPDRSSDRYSDDRYKHHHRSSKKSHHAGRGQSDSSERGGENDSVSRRKHDSYKEDDYAKNHRRHGKEIASGSHPRRCSKRTNEDMHESSRRQKDNNSDEDRKDVEGRQRPKRVHHH